MALTSEQVKEDIDDQSQEGRDTRFHHRIGDDDDGVAADDGLAVGGEFVADVGQAAFDSAHIADTALEGGSAFDGDRLRRLANGRSRGGRLLLRGG